MDQSACYKCGQPVEDGQAFCAHCMAPQIRVFVAPLAQAAGDIADDEVPAIGTDPPASRSSFQWAQALPPCAIAGLAAGLAMVLKLIVPLVAVVGAGFLAVGLYRAKTGHAIGIGAASPLGALCGLICFGITAVLGSVRVAVMHEGGIIHQALADAIDQTAARMSDPQSLPAIEFMRSPSGMILMMVCALIFVALLFLLLGTLGGALGGALLGRRPRK